MTLAISSPPSAPARNDPTMPPRELTIIVAATSKMGIGLRGTLPWSGLKKEMAYFARVTKRASDPSRTNTVIMGRKTWDSIPPRFRPLKDRRNTVISQTLPPSSPPDPSNPATVTSVSEALDLVSQPSNEAKQGRVFVIGGAQIYAAALRQPETKRILLTRILNDFECDTYFPVVLGENGEAEGWRRTKSEELDEWTGEMLSGKIQEEAGTRYVFEMWERVNEEP